MSASRLNAFDRAKRFQHVPPTLVFPMRAKSRCRWWYEWSETKPAGGARALNRPASLANLRAGYGIRTHDVQLGNPLPRLFCSLPSSHCNNFPSRGVPRCCTLTEARWGNRWGNIVPGARESGPASALEISNTVVTLAASRVTARSGSAPKASRRHGLRCRVRQCCVAPTVEGAAPCPAGRPWTSQRRARRLDRRPGDPTRATVPRRARPRDPPLPDRFPRGCDG